MELEIPGDGSNRSGRPGQKPGPWMEITLITGFIVSLVIGLGAAAALIMSLRGEETTLSTPASQTINAEGIVPQLALAQLAGDSAEALAYQAAAAGELDTASAVALYTTEFSGPQRLSLLLRLAERYQATDRMQEAAFHLNMAGAIAVLDPEIDGIERSTALARVAEGLLATGDDAASLDAAIQSMRAAEQTPGLLPTHRSAAYESLRPLADALNDNSFSQELAELTRNPYFEPTGVLISAQLPALRPEIPFARGADAEVAAAIAQREQSARVLADRILLTQGVDIDPEVQSLTTALYGEDQLREAYYRRVLNEGLSLQDQYALLLDRRDWTALKLRIARLGFGISLAPEWEQSSESLRQELGTATANLNIVAEAMANELANPVDQAMLRTESLLWQAQQAELGLYPDASMQDLNGRTQVAQQEMARLGAVPALPVAYEEDASPSGYRIQATR